MDLGKTLRSGQRVYGTLITSNSPRFVGVTAKMKLDYVFIDLEHVAIDRLTLAWMCEAYKANGLTPIVRISSHNPFEATAVLDSGAAGIVAPYVETKEQVQQLRGAVKLRPLKGEKLKKALETNEIEEKALSAYIEAHNSKNTLIVNIESTPAIEKLDEILAVPGLDAILIGPHDLSCSLGIPEQYQHPDFESAVIHIIKKARSMNIGAGIHLTYGDMEQQLHFAQKGANLILHEADIIAYNKSMQQDIQLIKNSLGDIDGIEKHNQINI